MVRARDNTLLGQRRANLFSSQAPCQACFLATAYQRGEVFSSTKKQQSCLSGLTLSSLILMTLAHIEQISRGFISTQSLPRHDTECITNWECWGHHKNINLDFFFLFCCGFNTFFPKAKNPSPSQYKTLCSRNV